MAEKETEIKKEGNILEKFFSNKTNVWMTVSIVLAVLLIGVLIMPRGLSSNAAGEKLVNFLNGNVVADGGVELENVSDAGNMYLVNVLYQGQSIPVYITKDGGYFVQGATPIPSSDSLITGNAVSGSAVTDVPKTDKPVVEAFIFSYCPYGLQFEKALIPVYNLLKNKADINVVAIGAMHGEFEKIESIRQLCVQKLYGKDKLMVYLEKFNVNTDIGSCNGNAACLEPLIKQVDALVGIDSNKVTACMSADGENLYNADTARAASLGIGGSPTFVINGVEVSVGRNPESIKQAICDAFTNAPSECSQTLSSDSATAGFGGGTGASTGASC